MWPENAEGRPRAGAASKRVNDDGVSVQRRSDRARANSCGRSAAAALRSLRPADRQRVLDRLTQLEELGQIARQRGTLAGVTP
jgi:hypothetical protein